MSTKTIKVYYYFPMIRDNKKCKIVDLKEILKGLDDMDIRERVLEIGEGNIQLKKINYDEIKKRWYLCFLRNTTDAPFKAKLQDDVDIAEILEDDEFIGQECCCIYDENSNIIALQNNRYSISYNGLAEFFNSFIEDGIFFNPITFREEYSNISDEDSKKYRSIILGFTDITKLNRIAKMEENKAVEFLATLSNDISALNGKLELNVGRSKKFLGKDKLKILVNFFKKHSDLTNTLKVKMFDGDTVRLIDLINNKVYDSLSIVISKNDPKTFDKILDPMDILFDTALKKTLNECENIMSV